MINELCRLLPALMLFFAETKMRKRKNVAVRSKSSIRKPRQDHFTKINARDLGGKIEYK